MTSAENGVEDDEESTVNEIMYARGGPRARGARGFNFCAKMLARWKRGGETEREREGGCERERKTGSPRVPLNLELSLAALLPRVGRSLKIKGPRKS